MNGTLCVLILLAAAGGGLAFSRARESDGRGSVVVDDFLVASSLPVRLGQIAATVEPAGLASLSLNGSLADGAALFTSVGPAAPATFRLATRLQASGPRCVQVVLRTEVEGGTYEPIEFVVRPCRAY